MGESFWHVGGVAPASSGSCREKQRPGLGATRTWGRRGQPGQAPDLLLTCRSLSMWARHSSRSLSPGTTTVPNGTAGGQSGRQQPAAPHHPALRGPSAPQRPQPHSPLTGLFELLLVIVQGLVVVHADPAHLDPQLLRHRLLAAGGATTQHSARAPPGLPVPARHRATCPTQLPRGTVSLLSRWGN